MEPSLVVGVGLVEVQEGVHLVGVGVHLVGVGVQLVGGVLIIPPQIFSSQ